MNIGLIDVDGKGVRFPNLALMKLSAWHKSENDNVEWYTPFTHYDIVYMSRVFTFSTDWQQPILNADKIVRGGTGYNFNRLPEPVEYTQPDYSLYRIDNSIAYGFLTRGCCNKCPWCVVPMKEGSIHPYMDIDNIMMFGTSMQKKNAILMDNNVLASDYGLMQIEKIVMRKYRVDFNQAIDARLVTDDIAKLLSQVKWIKRIRFGCDTPSQIGACENAITKLRNYGYSGEVFLYCIITSDFNESVTRIDHWKCNKHVIPYAQPFKSIGIGQQATPTWQKDLARYTNRKEIYKSLNSFSEFIPRIGFKCEKYYELINN